MVNLESLKSVRAQKAPPQVITSFQSSGGIGLIVIVIKFHLQGLGIRLRYILTPNVVKKNIAKIIRNLIAFFSTFQFAISL